ncbi:coiled-coil domain-containing protein 160 [Rhincodon typus]|uniref:coiled-coil domain-containing protein 160 n=1 Tax=Rhincodon typus TaxID=259920 RepID=UPI002030C518|nr:coiled-coil domain-containing protein 160 [Rhincodon typus]XP_048461111.1 coiled-coil domain-containing protein 160 [Rhincodon typus]
MEEHHWVEALFPPRFNMQDLIGVGVISEPVLLSENFAVRRVKRIKNIYQQNIENFQQEQKLKRKAYFSGQTVSAANTQTPIEDLKLQMYGNRHAGMVKSEKSDGSTENIIDGMEEQCVWNTEELTALHEMKCRKDIKQQHLQAQLALAHFQAEELKTRNKKLKVCLEIKEAELHKTKLDLQNNALYLGHTMQESIKKDLQIRGLKGELQEKMVTMHNLSSQLQRNRLETQDLRLEKQKLISSWKQLEQEHQLEKVHLLERWREKSSLQLKKRQTELDTVKTELKKEKCQHAQNKQALELLRKHCSSLPSLDLAEDFKVTF